MPELMNIDFGVQVWKAKSRQFAVERLMRSVREDDDTDSGSRDFSEI
jgi:hypothetical protein